MKNKRLNTFRRKMKIRIPIMLERFFHKEHRIQKRK